MFTPTYDGSNQAVHPDVIHVPGGFAGHDYWMAMTPYPGSNDDFENPSILVSDDGWSWSVPAGLTNPIDAAPTPPNYNSDTDLVLHNGVLHCFYRESDDATVDMIKVRTSTDGVAWSAEQDVFTAPYRSMLSPAVVWDGSQWVMYAVDATTDPNRLSRRTSASLTSGWSAASQIVLTPPDGGDMWHVDALRADGTLYLLLNVTDQGGSANGRLFLARSANGTTWTFDTVPLLRPTSHWDARIYRATGVIDDGQLTVWYSAQSATSIWRIGRTFPIPLS